MNISIYFPSVFGMRESYNWCAQRQYQTLSVYPRIEGSQYTYEVLP